MTSDQAKLFNLIAELGGSDERLGGNSDIFINAPLLKGETNTRAVPDVPELVRYRLNQMGELVYSENGQYVLHSQAAEIIAAKEAELSFAVSDEDKGAWRFWSKKSRDLADKNKSLRERAEAAEAELAQIKAQKPVAWMHPEAGWTDVSKAEVSAQCKPSTYPKPLYAAPVDQTAEIERLREVVKDCLKELDRSARPSYAWQLKARAALSGKEPS